MKFFFTSFGLHNPFIVGDVPEHAVYPISSDTGAGLDLDYSTLLLANSYYIDKDAFSRITADSSQFLKPMKSSLLTLKKEGLLELVDFSAIVSTHRPEIEARTEKLLENPTIWLPEARSQWSVLKPELEAFHASFGSSTKVDINTTHFGIYNYLLANGGTFSQSAHDEILKLFLSKKRTWSRQEIEDIRGSLRPLVGQILINELVRRKVDVPLLDWDDAQGFYEKLYLGTWDSDQSSLEIQHRARHLFSAVIPKLKPKNVESVIRFVRDEKAVVSLRTELLNSIESNETIDERWFLNYVNGAVQRDLTVRGKVRLLRWVGAVAGAFLPGASVLQEVAASVGEEAAEGKAMDALEAHGTRSYRWYYALQKEANTRDT